MYSKKFLKFIEIWQKDFAIERSIDEKLCVDKNGNPLPWYTYPAIEYLAQFDYSNKNIFEYGCGYSSLFWASRANKVTSVEDNPEWFDKWQKEFHCKNLEILQRNEGANYFNSILEKKNISYDVIVIDGKNRAECSERAVRKLSSDGIIILDDSDRVNTSKEYSDAIIFLRESGLLQVDFFGFCPMNNYTKTTSVFFRRQFNFKSKNPVQPINGIGNLWSMGRKQRKDFYKENL